jgi:hypothetical protein
MNNVFLLQLDGVSGPVLDHALKENLMPFTASLLKKGWVKRDFFCGLPSTTPASQMSLLYGINDFIVGYRFLLKKEKMVFDPMHPESLFAMEEIASKRNAKSLTRDGATIITLFSGGAPSTISASGVHSKKTTLIRVVDFLSNPFRSLVFFIKILIFMIIEHKEYALDSRGHFIDRIQRLQHILRRMAEEITVGELGLYFSKQSVREKKPVIYVDFTGYDEIAHSYGPMSRFALYYLSILDLYIKRCFEAIHKSGVPYELMIFSDHGQVASVPYEKLTGKKLETSIQELYPQKRIFQGSADPLYSDIQTHDLVIMSSGGFGLVYDIATDTQLSKDEMEKRYPDFFSKVSGLTGVECVVGRENGKVIAVRKGKKIELRPDSVLQAFPLIDDKISAIIALQFEKLTKSPWGADAYIVGEIGADSCVGFELQLGAHGSLGGNQTASFCISHNVSFEEEKITDFAGIYKVLHNYIYTDG